MNAELDVNSGGYCFRLWSTRRFVGDIKVQLMLGRYPRRSSLIAALGRRALTSLDPS